MTSLRLLDTRTNNSKYVLEREEEGEGEEGEEEGGTSTSSTISEQG